MERNQRHFSRFLFTGSYFFEDPSPFIFCIRSIALFFWLHNFEFKESLHLVCGVINFEIFVVVCFNSGIFTKDPPHVELIRWSKKLTSSSVCLWSRSDGTGVEGGFISRGWKKNCFHLLPDYLSSKLAVGLSYSTPVLENRKLFSCGGDNISFFVEETILAFLLRGQY